MSDVHSAPKSTLAGPKRKSLMYLRFVRIVRHGSKYQTQFASEDQSFLSFTPEVRLATCRCAIGYNGTGSARDLPTLAWNRALEPSSCPPRETTLLGCGSASWELLSLIDNTNVTGAKRLQAKPSCRRATSPTRHFLAVTTTTMITRITAYCRSWPHVYANDIQAAL